MLADWFETPKGSYVLAWERGQFDAAVEDVFGYNAVLLGFELTGGRFGCYAPPFSQGRWLERFGFMEKAGDRWWPICGAVYVVRAIKRNVGLRLVLPEWRDKRAAKKALAPVTQRQNGLHVEKRERR